VQFRVGADDEIGQDTARPAGRRRLSPLRVGSVGCRRPEPDVTRETQIDSDPASGQEVVEGLDRIPGAAASSA